MLLAPQQHWCYFGTGATSSGATSSGATSIGATSRGASSTGATSTSATSNDTVVCMHCSKISTGPGKISTDWSAWSARFSGGGGWIDIAIYCYILDNLQGNNKLLIKR